MKRIAMFVLAAGAAFAQFEPGTTSEKYNDASPAPAASTAPAAAPASPAVPMPGDHGAHHGQMPMAGSGAGSGAGGHEAGPEAAKVSPAGEGKVAVDTGEVAFEMPAAWKSVPPANMMRKAQVVIPKLDGDPEDGELAVSFFPGGGGGLEANVSRWYGQFETADGKPVNDTAKRETLKAGALEVTFLDITGTMKASGMPGMGSPVDKKDWHMLGGIVMTQAGPWFFKATGPEKTMVAARDAFKAMLGTVKAK